MHYEEGREDPLFERYLSPDLLPAQIQPLPVPSQEPNLDFLLRGTAQKAHSFGCGLFLQPLKLVPTVPAIGIHQEKQEIHVAVSFQKRAPQQRFGMLIPLRPRVRTSTFAFPFPHSASMRVTRGLRM